MVTAQTNNNNNLTNPSTAATNYANEIKTLSDYLLEWKVITQDQYDKIKLENLNFGKSEEQIIVDKKLATKEQITKARGALYNIPYVSLKDISTSPEAINLLPESVAEHYVVFPYAIDNLKGTLSLVMADPLDLNAIEFLEQKTRKKISPSISTPEQIKEAISQHYTKSLSSEITEALKESDSSSGSQAQVVDANSLGRIIKEAPIAKIVATLLDFASQARASDIHIEPLEDKTRIRYRIDGILHEKLVLPKSIHESLISRIKILSGMKIDEKRIPQDGRFNFKAEGVEIDLRVSSLPSVHGEKIVMRLLKKTGNVPTLSELGLRARALTNLEESIILPHGIILITGPTGSGKTTTLYSILSKINTTRVNIVTLEDPIEYEISGVNQVQVNPQAGLTFASGLRSFLRQDPNIIMVGEIRDEETAELAVQAALTGHLVFATLHTNSAAGALPRLLDMHAEPYLLASSLTCVVAQRVVRCLCPNCKESYQPAQEVILNIKQVLGNLYTVGDKLTLYKGKGCEKCNDTGYFGRIGIYEALLISEKISRFILEHAPEPKIEAQAREEGMVTMTQDGYLKAIQGITTIEEVLRVSKA